jgi:hypothetical protein
MILTPENPRWDEFICALADAVTQRGCSGTSHRHHAKKVMADMGDVDIAESLAFFESHGGYCDCEILFNVEPDEEGETEQ